MELHMTGAQEVFVDDGVVVEGEVISPMMRNWSEIWDKLERFVFLLFPFCYV